MTPDLHTAAGLRVTDVERVVVRVPLRERCRQWNEIFVGQWEVVEVLRVSTNAKEIVGYGETQLHYTSGPVSQEAVERVRGANPADLLPDDRLGRGLQMALYDIVGKALGVPLYRLLGPPKVRERCPLSWWSTDMPPEVLAAEARDALAEGYLSHKFKARPWFDVYAQVEQVSAASPGHYRLGIDWNSFLLDVGTAAPVLAELDRHDRIGMFETPIRQTDIDGHRRLRDLLIHPVIEHFVKVPYATGARADAYDGYVVSWRGIAGLVEAGLLVGALDKPFFLQLTGTGITTALALHLGAVLPGARWGYVTCLNIFADDLLVDPITVSCGEAGVPEAPGLGITVDEDALDRLRMAPPYRVDYPRRLLTVSWPGGRERHYVDDRQLWRDGLAGNLPAQEPGATLTVREDDGGSEWAALYQRALPAGGDTAHSPPTRVAHAVKSSSNTTRSAS